MPADKTSAGAAATAPVDTGAAVALDGCRIWRPEFSGARVEIVSADARPRAFPLRVTETLGICLKAGFAHGVRADGRSVTYPADSVCIRAPGCVWTSEAAPVAFLSIDIGGDWLPAEGVRGAMTFAPRSELPDIAAIVSRVTRAAHAGSVLEADVALAELVTAAIGVLMPRAPALRDDGGIGGGGAAARVAVGAGGTVAAGRSGGRGAAGAGVRGVMRARDFLAAHADQNPTLETLARHASMNKFVLVRAFRRVFGTTPHAYLMAVRLERARALLADGMRSIDASAATGFADQAHFSRWFKRRYGMTPAAYAGRTRPLVTGGVNSVQDRAAIAILE
jgi:AraC-like DNA-binding protein